ncbi:hypothetical protein B23_0445 [Geobacillus thermoleovorans B23]|nr:hypothetical protein B23_0445 [Geobacillus thermoleovorans B23]
MRNGGLSYLEAGEKAERLGLRFSFAVPLKTEMQER